MSTITSPTLFILVFKTNIRFDIDMPHLKMVLSTISGIERWNFDRHDADNILRIESPADVSRDIITALNHNGYYCAELED